MTISRNVVKYKKAWSECVICGRKTHAHEKTTGKAICSGKCLNQVIRANFRQVVAEKVLKKAGGVFLPPRRRW